MAIKLSLTFTKNRHTGQKRDSTQFSQLFGEAHCQKLQLQQIGVNVLLFTLLMTSNIKPFGAKIIQAVIMLFSQEFFSRMFDDRVHLFL
jgi:hypothetical protein